MCSSDLPVLRLVAEAGGTVASEDFAAAVRLTADIPAAAAEAFRRGVNDASRGTARIEAL